ncbi:GntR family transcriptional regulator [Paractinoplanes lichenicola]|uniref:GntR family transcriptional regulator n=1 Tax=Paractinoplanes lichenicola TaxID=2802976 RepID=A0ABS1W303_9ACTN|nr:GntR family transcriptional regulator [Actinoplanes lichenicola]MBL7261099.1 GntR family transcriptional regulator [Actinoplanes lichenicola]
MTVTTQRVAEQLRKAILGGHLAPGERVRQEEVAQQLGASRLPVREALQMLAAEGMVEHEPNKGARVPWLSMREVDVMYKMREQLEPLALAESMPFLLPGDLLRLEEIQDEIEAGVSVEQFLALDREFHLRTYSACGIDHLNATVTRLWNSTQYYRRAFMQISGPSRRWVVNAEHRLLMDALGRGDEIDAGRFLAGHIRRTRIELNRHPEVFGED